MRPLRFLRGRCRVAWRRWRRRPVVARDGDERYVFRCETDLERARAETLFSKEAGTVAWIRERVEPGETFYDVGANIGLYTLLAAHRVGPGGRVYAFEPHAPNFVSLLHNVHLNRMSDRVVPLCCALHDRRGFFDFHYHSVVAGSSMHQLDCRVDGDEVAFQPVISERKLGMTVDALLEEGVIRPAHHVKIDVDGNELLVLRGMRRLLTGGDRPRSLQVEINRRYKAELFAFLSECGYEQRARHDTAFGKSLLAAGRDPETVAHNAVFGPRLAEGAPACP